MTERTEQQEEDRRIDLDTPKDGVSEFIQNIENPKETGWIEKEKKEQAI